MMRLCLDTPAYSHFKRGDPQVVDLIDRADWLGVPVVVLGELAVGFRLGKRRLNDIWIATVAVRHGATVLTYDQHFRSIARVGATILTAPNV